jgi:hypothetical protein
LAAGACADVAVKLAAASVKTMPEINTRNFLMFVFVKMV